MADDKPLAIPIDSIERDFAEFLSPDSNKRIIFSGPFGIGKTYFLDKFFKPRDSKYFPIFLCPINYSLLSNEDIFKLIKYDIIFQILKDIDISSEFEFSKLEYSLNFLNFNKYLILKNLLRHIPVIKQGIEMSQDIEKLVEIYQKGWSQINDSENKNFLKDFYEANENHFLLEFDQVSKFILEQLCNIAQKKGTPENPTKKILIIDDLDRLDPEHIFRLFNVFSAHFNYPNHSHNGDVSDNKFGFDKIIFVCDIENIHKIFAHKYGIEVDFSGYIDKFYSHKIYDFNNSKEIVKFVDRIFKHSEDRTPQRGGSYSELLSIIKPIFVDFISSKAVNHRIIKKIELGKRNFEEPHRIHFYESRNFRNYNLKAIQVFEYLFNVFGRDYSALEEAIQKSKNLHNKKAQSLIQRQIDHFLPFLNPRTDFHIESYWHYENNRITYKIVDSLHEDGVFYAEIDTQKGDISWLNGTNYYEILHIVYTNMRSMGVFEFSED